MGSYWAKKHLETGDAFVARKELVEICEKYNAYDVGHFAKNMSARKDYFLEKGDGWLVTIPGLKAAGEAIKQLAS